MGSSVFHPEASRVARMAAGGRYGLAQSLFQVGGNMGSALGPVARRLHRRAARPARASRGSPRAALVAMFVLFQVGGWYARAPGRAPKPARRGKAAAAAAAPRPVARPRDRRRGHPGGAALLQERLQRQPRLLLHLLPDRQVRHLTCRRRSSTCSPSWSASWAAPSLGGAVGDRVGRIPVMWFSILGALPFALMLPHANLFWTGVLAVPWP